MTPDAGRESGPRVSLERRIREVEARLADRQRAVGAGAAALESGVRAAMTSPLALLAAVGAGFAIGQYSKRRRAAPQVASGPAVVRPSIFATLMEVLTLASTVMAILPALRRRPEEGADAAGDVR